MFVLGVLAQIAIFFLVLSFLIFIHELGHYLFAKWQGVHVEEFGFGYPPLFKKLGTFWGTEFTVNWIPFGGFVRLEGEEGPGEEEKSGTALSAKERKTVGIPFYKKSLIGRLLIIIAGALFNFIFAVLGFALVYSVNGIPEQLNIAKIGEVRQNSPAEKAGLAVGQRISGVVIDGQTSYELSPEKVIEVIGQNRGKTIEILTSFPCPEDASCALEHHTVYLRTAAETPEGEGTLGVRFEPVFEVKYYPWYEMPIRGTIVGIQESFALIQLILQGLGQVASQAGHGKIPSELSGPVLLFYQGYKQNIFSSGFWILLKFTAIISMNLAILNLLPIPALDGGRGLFLLLEKVVGKKHIERVEGYVNYGAFIFLIGLTVLVTIKDIIFVIRDIFFK